MKNLLLIVSVCFLLCTSCINTLTEQDERLSQEALVLFENGKTEEAVKLYEVLADRNKNNQHLLFMYGKILYFQGKQDQALPYLEKAYRLDKRVVKSTVLYGKVLLEMGQLPEAMEVFEKILVFDPDNFSVNRALGTFYHDRGEYDKALVYYKHILWIEKIIGDTYNDLASIYTGFEDPQKAAVFSTKAKTLLQNRGTIE